jgi:hypothetical protein
VAKSKKKAEPPLPGPSSPAGIRNRAMLGTLAYSACRVGELVALRVGGPPGEIHGSTSHAINGTMPSRIAGLGRLVEETSLTRRLSLLTKRPYSPHGPVLRKELPLPMSRRATRFNG